MAIDFQALASRLLSESRTLLPSWLPAGKFRGHEFVVGDLAGKPGESLSININTGRWADFASGEKGGDLVSLYAAIHHIEQGEAAKQLGLTTVATPAIKPKSERKRDVIVPVPSSAPRCACNHYEYGNPSAVWPYRNAVGELLGYVARYDPEGQRKQIVPWTFARDGRGKERWTMGHWPEPRPLYGLDDLSKRPDAPVMVVEGEKSADAARKIASQYVVLTWPGGSNAWRKADFAALAGRTILLWPDADEPGIKCMWEIAHYLFQRCPVVKIIIPDDHTDGWDAADALAEGFGWEKFKEWALARVQQITDQKGAPSVEQADAGFKLTSPDTPNISGPAEPVSQVGRWLAWALDRTGNGLPIANLNNAVKVLEHDATLKSLVWYDEFLQRLLTQYRRGDEVYEPREWTEADDINLTLYMQRAVGLSKISRDIVSQAVKAVAFRDVRNSVKDWMESLNWDGEARIDKFYEDHFGAHGSAYCLSASKNFWISMVARAFVPGCKVDNMIVLEGEQGIGKSRALQIIGGQWFTEQHESVTGKGFFEVLQGKILIEIGELDSFSRGDITRVKEVITQVRDRYRESYGRYAEDHPRRCVFVGTTNKDDWNKDETGARRFWPIACQGEIDYEGIRSNREQLFAEAVVRFKAGESWWKMPVDETVAEQSNRYNADAWLEPIQDFLGLKQNTSINEILEACLKFEIGDVGIGDQMRVATCLRKLGWRGRNERLNGAVRKIWRPVGAVSEVANGANASL
jgi:putative DNA primase/helicase